MLRDNFLSNKLQNSLSGFNTELIKRTIEEQKLAFSNKTRATEKSSDSRLTKT